MKRLILLLLLLSVGLNVGLGIALKRQRDELDALPPWAFNDHGPQHPDSGDRPFHKGHMCRLREMRKRIEPQLRMRQADLDIARAALKEALGRPEADEEEILARVSAMIAAQGGIDSLLTSNLVSELKQMSPDERREVIRMIDRFGGRRGSRPPDSP